MKPLTKIIVKVTCDVCKSEFNWNWGDANGNCPKCGRVKVKNIKLQKGEIKKLFA